MATLVSIADFVFVAMRQHLLVAEFRRSFHLLVPETPSVLCKFL